MLVAFNLRAIATGDPLVAMLVTSVMFGYGAGIVGRLGARPGRARGRLQVCKAKLRPSEYRAGASKDRRGNRRPSACPEQLRIVSFNSLF